MRQIDEVASILQKRDYPINNIIFDVMKKFKIKTLVCKSGMKKGDGYAASEIVILLVIMPLMLLKSVHGLYRSEFEKTVEMKKDVFYRFKNNECNPWRRLLYMVAKKFVELTERARAEREPYQLEEEERGTTAFIIDDTTDRRVGYKGENISRVFDHSLMKSVYGFKHLVLGYFDGRSIIPLDFSTHKEKKLERKKAKKQYNKEVRRKSQGEKRRKEANSSKIDNALAMVRRAVKNGFLPDYVLVDSWFTSLKFISQIRGIKNGSIHVIAGIKKDKRKYMFDGQLFDAGQIIRRVRSEGNERRNRSYNVRYYEVSVNYAGVGDVKLFICRYPFQRKWRVFISTDTSLGFVGMMKAYGIRWTVEVMFRGLKQHLNLGGCQSRDFDAQIASVTISLILYTLLSYAKRVESYETIGALFQYMQEELNEKNLAEKLWNLFEEILQLVIDIVSQNEEVDVECLKKTSEYLYVKELFESSFLTKQLKEINKAA